MDIDQSLREPPVFLIILLDTATSRETQVRSDEGTTCFTLLQFSYTSTKSESVYGQTDE
jgi:hypothetical protein